MSINCHLHGIPSPNNDVESLIYTLLYMTNKGLPWLRLNCANKSYYKATLEMKINFDFIDYYNEEYSFLLYCLEYLKKVNKKKEICDYNVLRTLFFHGSNKKLIQSENKEYKFKFVEEIMNDIINELKEKNGNLKMRN